jgi:hypothetical protein
MGTFVGPAGAPYKKTWNFNRLYCELGGRPIRRGDCPIFPNGFNSGLALMDLVAVERMPAMNIMEQSAARG